MDYPGFQKMLDDVEWHEIGENQHSLDWGDDLYATHEGILKIAEFEFKVYQLNDGQRIIDRQSLEKFFGTAVP